jgi:acetyl esterase/lipase
MLMAVAGGSVLAAALSACSATSVLNALEPKSGVAADRNLAYAAGPRHALDVYQPRRAAPGAPVVVFLYGGGWDSGRKDDYAFVGDALASKGFLTIIPDYRLYPEAHYPDFLTDCALAVRWAKDHASAYGGDSRRIFLMGHSAGAYNAAMLALDPRWLGAVGLNPLHDVAGLVGLAGPYDFLPLQSAELKAIFGASGQLPDSQPVAHVAPGDPPAFLAHDLGDKVVFVRNTEHLAARLQSVGGVVETRYYKGLSHALLIGAFAAPLRLLSPVLSDAAAFIRQHAVAQGSS